MMKMPSLPPANNIITIPSDLGDQLPDYAEGLTAFHNAFARELRNLVNELPLTPPARVLDLASGDGFFTACFARRHPRPAQVVAADQSREFLEMARRVSERSGVAAFVTLAEADAYALPFEECSFDLVWCAQSLISLKEVPKVLREMHRVLRPDGMVAILENDDLHHVLPNMPMEMELALFKALAARRQEQGGEQQSSPVRRLEELLGEAGFQHVTKRSVAFDRSAPFDSSTKRFLASYFAQLRDEVENYLSQQELIGFDRLTDGTREDSFFHHPTSELTCLNFLFTAIR